MNEFTWPISIESKNEMQTTAAQIVLGGMYTQTIKIALKNYIDLWDIVTMPLYYDEKEKCKKFIYDNLGGKIRFSSIDKEKQYTILNDNVNITPFMEGQEIKFVINFSVREIF